MVLSIGNYHGLNATIIADNKRFQINSVDSNMKNTKVGIPHGSSLCPTLFLVDINDLPCTMKNSHVLMYTDYTSIYDSSKDII